MDTPIWVTILVGIVSALITGGATWRAGVRYGEEIEKDRALKRVEREDEREQRFVDHIKSGMGAVQERNAG